MQTIRLQPCIGFHEVSNWTHNGAERVEFVVQRDARFVALAEGVAVGRLHDLRMTAALVSVTLHFPVNGGSALPDVWKALQQTPAITGVFGLGLLLIAQTVTDSVGTPVRDVLIRAFWDHAQKTGGLFGDGKRQTVIAREPNAPLAACLVERGQQDFPSPGKFTKLLETIARELGAGRSLAFSAAEQCIATFLYEAARNSWEHAREDGAGTILSGTRGIIVEKLIVHNAADLAKRRDLPEFARSYLQRVHEARGEKEMFALAVTVADYGRGIHHTLSPIEGENAWMRLERAFLPGQSRKTRGSDLNWGEGLPKIVGVCGPPLRAFLFIRSAELAGIADFSLPREPNGPLLTPVEHLVPVGCGTSVSMLWALAGSGESHDQQTLF